MKYQAISTILSPRETLEVFSFSLQYSSTHYSSIQVKSKSSLFSSILFHLFVFQFIMTAAPVNKKARLEYNGPALELKCINTIRAVSADQPEAANSGHPGAPMGCAPMAHLLWAEVMKYSSQDPKWINRDRFVLSNGHACALQYTMLHLTGYNVSVEDLSQFRQIGSKTPGHPESFVTDGTCIHSWKNRDWL